MNKLRRSDASRVRDVVLLFFLLLDEGAKLHVNGGCRSEQLAERVSLAGKRRVEGKSQSWSTGFCSCVAALKSIKIRDLDSSNPIE